MPDSHEIRFHPGDVDQKDASLFIRGPRVSLRYSSNMRDHRSSTLEGAVGHPLLQAGCSQVLPAPDLPNCPLGQPWMSASTDDHRRGASVERISGWRSPRRIGPDPVRLRRTNRVRQADPASRCGMGMFAPACGLEPHAGVGLAGGVRSFQPLAAPSPGTSPKSWNDDASPAPGKNWRSWER